MAGKTRDDVDRLLADGAARGASRVATHLAAILPRRFVLEALAAIGIDPKVTFAQLKRPWRQALATILAARPVVVTGVGDWSEAMVTVGGCALDEINPRTMESRRVRGLHVVGELLDVAGPTGGYNLHVAFATGRLAARSVLRPSQP